MSDELPQGWTPTTLGEICSKPQYGWTCSGAKAGRVKYLRTTDISDDQIDWSTVPFCAEVPDDIEKYRVRTNDIVVSRAGSVGVSHRIKNVPCDAVFASYLIRFNPLDGIEPRFVEAFFKSRDYWKEISDFTAGIAIPNVNASKLASLELPLAPLAEQQRITAKLDKLLDQVNGCQQRLTRIPVLLKRFRQSVLSAAVSGRLTADWREERNVHPAELEPLPSSETQPDWPEEWRSVSLKDVAVKVQDGNYGALYPKADEWISAGVAFIVPAAIASDGKIDLSKVRFISPERNAELKKAQLTEGDVIFPNRGSRDAQRNGFEPFAISVPKSLLPANINPQLTLVRPRREILASDYLRIALNSEYFLSQVRETTGGSALTFINLTETKSLLIPLPPFPEQQEIVRRVESFFSLADRIEARFTEGRKRVDGLTQAILAKAFRGELVPTEAELAEAEGRSFESAEELLDRIKRDARVDEGRKKQKLERSTPGPRQRRRK